MHEPEFDCLEIVGFRISYDSELPDLYTLFICGNEEKDKIVSYDGTLLFVSAIADIDLLYPFLDTQIRESFAKPENKNMVFDLAQALYLLENEEQDRSAAILDCLNVIFDLFYSAEIILPEEKKKMLYGLADHLTFANDFPVYLEQSSYSRAAVIDNVLWCLGKLLTFSKVIKPSPSG